MIKKKGPHENHEIKRKKSRPKKKKAPMEIKVQSCKIN